MFNEWSWTEWFLLVFNLLVITLIIWLVRRKFVKLMDKVEKRHNQSALKRRMKARELVKSEVSEE